MRHRRHIHRTNLKIRKTKIEEKVNISINKEFYLHMDIQDWPHGIRYRLVHGRILIHGRIPSPTVLLDGVQWLSVQQQLLVHELKWHAEEYLKLYEFDSKIKLAYQ